MIMFTKVGCQKCDWLKKNAVLTGIEVYELSDTNYEALGLLAWHEGVGLAETTLPILVLEDDSKVTGAVNIKNILSKRH